MIEIDRWWFSCVPTDMRRGIDGLSAQVLAAFEEGLAPRTAYLFCNKSGTRLKVLCWDGLGFWLCMRRLERARFTLPEPGTSMLSLSAEQFAWLVAGVDWRRLSTSPKMLSMI